MSLILREMESVRRLHMYHVKSRITNSVRNAKVATLFYFLNLILQFLSRRIFILYLGNEVLGLNTTAQNLLQFLNLAELGIGSAVSFFLYKPLAENNVAVINEIVSLQGYLYRRIGLLILGVSLLLIFFFPWIFKSINLPQWYPYATFGVLLFSSLLGYFFNYQQIILVSDQKEYKLNYIIQSIKLCKFLFQIVFILSFSNGYIWWLLIEVAASICTVIGIRLMVLSEYPWLCPTFGNGKILLSKYSEITKKTKQLFFHKIAGFALTQTSPLILFAYASLVMVAKYGNYLLVITGVTALLGALFNSINASVGNLVAEGNKQHILDVFEELFSIRVQLSATACFVCLKLMCPFISLWVGEEQLLDDMSLYLLVLIMYINLSRLAVDSFINAYGLFSDIWAPLLESLLNVGLAVLLGHFWGLPGILTGSLISLIVVVFCWRPLFLFRKGICVNFKIYVKLYFKQAFAIVTSFIISDWIIDNFFSSPINSFVDLMLYGISYSLIFGVLSLCILLYIDAGMRRFFKKLRAYLR